MITFSQLKTGVVGDESGLDVESDDFLKICRAAVRQLMNRGGFFSTVQPMNGCVRDNIITWPRHVGTILALNVCNRPSQLSNRWYQFMPLDPSHVRDALHYEKFGWGGNLMTESVGTSPVFNPIKSAGMVIRTFISQPTDAGKTITWFGTDGNGQNIRTERSDGTFQDGVRVVLANPYVDTPFVIRHVSRVVKDETNGPLNCYQYSASGNFLIDLAQYQPTEMNPEYVTTRITGCRSGGWNGIAQISALVKLEFVPFKYDSDLVQIDSEDAIRDMVLSIRKKGQGDLGGAGTYEASAIRELQKQLQQKFPIEQFQVSSSVYGSARLNKVMGGFI